MKKLLNIILVAALCITAFPLSFIGCGKIDVEKFVYPAFEKLQDLNKYTISVSYTKENKNCVETRMFETVLEKDFSYYTRTEDNLTVLEVWFENRGEEKTCTTKQGETFTTEIVENNFQTILQNVSDNPTLLEATNHFINLENLNNTEISSTQNGYSVVLDEKSFEIESRSVASAMYGDKKVFFDYSLKTFFPTTPYSYEATEEVSTTFQTICEKLEKLELLANEYIEQNNLTTSNKKLMLEYIRVAGYNTSQWNDLCGNVDTNFATFVSENQGETDVESLKTIYKVVVPATNKEFDFVHFFATLNMAQQRGLSIEFDLAGYGGDIAQLAADIKSTTLSEEELLEKAKNLLGTEEPSVFGSLDLMSDLMAINIATTMIQNPQKSVVSIFKEYCLSVSETEQIRMAVKNLGFENNTKEDFGQAVLSRVKNNLYIQVWLANNDAPVSKHLSTLSACANAFADYIYDRI